MTFSWLIPRISESTSKSSTEQLWGSESMSRCRCFPDNRSKKNDMRKKLVPKEIIWIWIILHHYINAQINQLSFKHFTIPLLDSARFFTNSLLASPGRHIVNDLLHFWKKGLRSQLRHVVLDTHHCKISWFFWCTFPMWNLDHVILNVSYQYFLDVVLILVINDCTHSSLMCSMIFYVLYVVSCCHMLFSKDKVTFLALIQCQAEPKARRKAKKVKVKKEKTKVGFHSWNAWVFP